MTAAPAPDQECDLEIAGMRLRVRETGHGDPILLLNGLGTHTAMWRPFERALPDRRIISFDAPGTGHSELPIGPLPMASLAAMVETLLDRLGEQERVDVVGYSFGGALAQQLARQAPQRIRRLVLAATTPGWGGIPGRTSSLMLMLTPLRYWSATFYSLTIPWIAGGQAHDPEFVRRHRRDRLAAPPSLLGYTGQLYTMSSWSSARWLPELNVPTLVLCGADDPLTPPVNSVLIAARMPDARLQMLEGEGHLLLLDAHGNALPTVRDFLDAPSLEDSEAWTTGRIVDEDEVAEALRESGRGGEPWGTMSSLYRRLAAARLV
ncbi:alpha/beta fold hydrolase [Capillimicrobium parvum]|uniref:AB hydrolase-1 domain-containing protein n=1 Tax=Capillimicrobium parvum TaxID=2884022 RepID=A0A9E7BX46_9ACTN|nr:alpha/beta hydrolase [Capillimicrobium parvum]UGS33975.1 hypothetical protein DSM104329_00342 [Capillimicrobium parvum]